MATVVVVGGGFGGLAVAVRAAKLGHEVTIIEAGDRLGGAVETIEQGGYAWDGGPDHLVLPAVVRDLFRKSGRALEAELGVPTGEELEPLEVLREHRFPDRTSVQLRSGRAAQREAFEELRRGLGDAWVDYVDECGRTWELLRRSYFEEPWDPAAAPAEVTALLRDREHLAKRLKRRFRDDRPAMVAAHPFAAEGHYLRDVPAWAGVHTYLEQCFGAWRLRGGMAGLTDLLVARLATRGVEVRLHTEVHDLELRDGRAAGVVLTGLADKPGEVVAADAVVVAVDPRRLPTLAPLVQRTMPALPPVVVHLGLQGEVPDLPHETVLHGDATLVVRPGLAAPEGGTAWTVHGRGKLSEDVVDALARAGLKVRKQVVTRVDRSPRDLVMAHRGSAYGVLWRGRSTVVDRLGPRTPVPGVYTAGAHATPGSGLAYVGLGAAQVATLLGPA
ncbi:phytoene desaturase family protein [Nocardioides sp.]|uniref:phytoene desaturase family protein n=1 Tax=Nocardioides sp. TaxID=35761 RepID=UPI0035160F9D